MSMQVNKMRSILSQSKNEELKKLSELTDNKLIQVMKYWRNDILNLIEWGEKNKKTLNQKLPIKTILLQDLFGK